jgi:tRNA-(ms[2]io[6]A)-hydroxylase
MMARKGGPDVLHLASETREDWLKEALDDLDAVLLDHTHCEKKAASTAINMIFRYADQPTLLRPLSEHAREELEHFELMLGVLEKRQVGFERLTPAPYAAELYKVVRKKEPDRLLDTLLCCSLIEARSCERMALLSDNLEDAELAELYRSLLASEARHVSLFVDLASEIFGREVTRTRRLEVAAHEALVLEIPGPEPRMHS